jgi:hypothetical protein
MDMSLSRVRIFVFVLGVLVSALSAGEVEDLEE